MNDLFEKPCIFITSLGRTGTHFFGSTMENMIANCTSVHEPDFLTFESPVNSYKKICEFGFFRMTLGKFLPRASIRGVGISRVDGRIHEDEAVKCLRQMRLKTLSTLKTEIYLEANLQFSVLIDLLPVAFPNARVVFIVRDPREWVRSWMNLPVYIYSMFDLRSRLRNGRLNPRHFIGDPCLKLWGRMTRFEKLCWVWAKENTYALECAKRSKAVKVFRYEDLFSESGNYEVLRSMFNFITLFPKGYSADWSLNKELLGKKTNENKKHMFPAWNDWNAWQAETLEMYCSPLMAQFGYGGESVWRRLLKKYNSGINAPNLNVTSGLGDL